MQSTTFPSNSAETLWDALQNTKLPIVLYGTGDGADKIISVMQERDIPLHAILVSDDFYRGQTFHGRPVTTLSALEAEGSDFIIAVAFGSHLPEIQNRVIQMASRHPVVVPDVPVYGDALFDLSFARCHAKELTAAYTLLADEESRRIFREVIRYKLTGSLTSLLATASDKETVWQGLLPLTNQERYLDLGAYRGDTIQEFLHVTGGCYDSITALEPDTRSFKKLSAYTANLPNVKLLPCGVSDRSEIVYMKTGRGRGTNRADSTQKGSVPVQMIRVDELGTPFTYIKMDVEGSEAAALRGAANALQTCQPKLNIACYHRSEDLYQLPLLIHQLQPNYQIYLRRHPCLPCWDLNLYCR